MLFCMLSIFGTQYSGMERVIFVENSLKKIEVVWSEIFWPLSFPNTGTTKVCFSLTRISSYKDRIVDSFLIQENTAQRKPIFWFILRSDDEDLPTDGKKTLRDKSRNTEFFGLYFAWIRLNTEVYSVNHCIQPNEIVNE